MPNIRVRASLDRISRELQTVVAHVRQYSGIDPKDAHYVDTAATGLSELAAALAAEARARQGDRSAPRLVGRVRKALGFTYPDPARPRGRTR